MSQPFIGEIRMFGGSFAPAGWAFCDGQLMAIAENDALFTLIGTTYGGDGQQTFGIPDLRGRVPAHMGTGPGLSTRVIGEVSGVETVTLTVQQIPQHTHIPQASTLNGNQSSPLNHIWAQSEARQFANVAASQPMSQSVAPVGGSQPHDNVMPFLTISFIISLFGVFPSQS